MAKGLIKKAFIDKHTGVSYNPGQNIEVGTVRLAELVKLGYVETREKLETKKEEPIEVKAEEVPEEEETPEVKPETEKPTAKKKK